MFFYTCVVGDERCVLYRVIDATSKSTQAMDPCKFNIYSKGTEEATTYTFRG